MNDVSVSGQSPSEQELRELLATSCRILYRLGLSDYLGHPSVRLPGTDLVLIKPRHSPTVRRLDDMTPERMVTIDFDGNLVAGSEEPPSERFIHTEIYKARPDAMCVLHTHTRAGAGLSLLRDGLRPISQDALHVLDDVAYHEYGVPASQEECDALGATCAKGSCVVLLNHGLLTWGETVHGALKRLYMLERACELEVMARMMGEPPVMVADEVVRKAAARMKKLRATPDYGLMEFEGLVRTVDRKGADYRR